MSIAYRDSCPVLCPQHSFFFHFHKKYVTNRLECDSLKLVNTILSTSSEQALSGVEGLTHLFKEPYTRYERIPARRGDRLDPTETSYIIQEERSLCLAYYTDCIIPVGVKEGKNMGKMYRTPLIPTAEKLAEEVV